MISGNIKFLEEMVEEFGDIKVTDLIEILKDISRRKVILNIPNLYLETASNCIKFEKSMES